MSALYEFRNTINGRGARAQQIDDNYNFGMVYTNSPLADGKVKTLVNYDIHDGGASLTTRPGTRAKTAFYNSELTFPTNPALFNARERRVSSDRSRSIFLVKSGLSASPVTTNELHTGTINVYTGDTADVATEDYLENNYAFTQNAAGAALSYFSKPAQAEIHGIELIDNLNLARHVGTFGWNDDYYFFNTSGKLVKTKLNSTDDCFEFEEFSPKVLTPKEAVTWGYNMLSANPYVFACTAAAAGGVLTFTGLLPYDTNDSLCLSPVLNQDLLLRLYYSVPDEAKYKIVVEWREQSTSDWATLSAQEITFDTADLDPIEVPFSSPATEVILRATAYAWDSGASAYKAIADNVLAVGLSFDKSTYGSTANITTQNYTITQASGVCYWQHRLMAWGVPEDPTMLFSSDINDPTYFPYPNQSDVLDEPIKFCLPFGDDLLVWTSSMLWLLSLNDDGLSWTKKRIQKNLSINDWDIHLTQPVKNMVFFRSGTYYYMIVPKSSSTTGELTLASISTNVYYLFDRFATAIADIVKMTYGYEDELTLVQYYNYLDFEDVHNVYCFQTTGDEYLNVSLLYNTVSRHWRIYAGGAPGAYLPYRQDATKKGILCNMVLGNGKPVFQLLQYEVDQNADYYLPSYTTENLPPAVFAAQHIFYNWQFLDTGYREHASNFKKRYRELQFTLNNRSNKSLKFYTDFLIDGEIRKSSKTYQLVHDIDPTSDTYGIITYEAVFAEPQEVPGSTILGETEDDEGAWELDYSQFPDTAFWKVRFLVSGKGYTPRLLFSSHNEEVYELLNVSWVFRTLNSR